jgi:HEAT repeat protein
MRAKPLLPLLVSITVAWGLGSCGCRDPEKQLQSPKPEERKEAIREIARKDSERAAEVLAPLAVHEDVSTASEAVRALGRMNNQRAAAVLRDVIVEEKRPPLREEAATALANDGTQQTAQVLREVAQSDTDRGVRAAAAAGLGRVGNSQDIPFLMQLVDSSVRSGDILTESRAFGAIERLCQLRFAYDSRDPLPERLKAIGRMKRVAPIASRELDRRKRLDEVEKGKR